MGIELDPDNIGFKEYILFFYIVPEHLLPKNEAISIAKEVLKKNPNNIAALNTLKK